MNDLKNRMTQRAEANKAAKIQNRLLKDSRNYKGLKLVEAWEKASPMFTDAFENMTETKKINTAYWLMSQYAAANRKPFGKLQESGSLEGVLGVSLQNLLTLVLQVTGKMHRGDWFSEYAMETAEDILVYVFPTMGRNQAGTNNFDKAHTMYDPDGAADQGLYKMDDLYDPADSGDERRKSIIESREYQAPNYLHAFGTAEAFNAGAGTAVFEIYKDTDKDNPFNKFGYTDGYVRITVVGDDRAVIAVQDKSTGRFRVKASMVDSPSVPVTFEYLKSYGGNNGSFLKVTGLKKNPTRKDVYGDDIDNPTDPVDLKLKAIGRFSPETDFNGEQLPEISLNLVKRSFRLQQTSIGVTMSNMMDITLDYSFGAKAEDLIMPHAAQFIRMVLDIQAVKMAYALALTNPKGAISYFDAYPNVGGGGGVVAKDTYDSIAQTLLSGLETVSDHALNVLNRGTLHAVIGGTSAATYATIHRAFEKDAAATGAGIHHYGKLGNIEVYKAPNEIIPYKDMLCILRNKEVEQDSSLLFAMLIPFVSTGLLTRKNFYKEAGLASYGDMATLNADYLRILRFKNLKDVALD